MSTGPFKKKIMAGYYFRRKNMWEKKSGLRFGSMYFDKDFRMGDEQVIELRDWLSRYINKYIHKKTSELTVETRAHARAIIRAQDALEAK